MQEQKEAGQENCNAELEKEIGAFMAVQEENDMEEIKSHLAWDEKEEELIGADIFLCRPVVIKKSEPGDSV